MKIIFLLLFLSLPFFYFSQSEVYTDEWYEKLNSELECFIFPNPGENIIKVRVYRGKSENHNITIFNSISEVIITSDFKRDIDMDISCLKSGIYYLRVSNENKNIHDILFIR